MADGIEAKVYNNIDYNQFVKKCQDNQIPCEHYEGTLNGESFVGPIVRTNRLELQRLVDKMLAVTPQIPLRCQPHGVGGFFLFPGGKG